MRRRLVSVLALTALALTAWPGTASADVIFDQADAEELAAVLAEAYEAQQVCYGWNIDVNNVGSQESSVGSNFGAGQPLDDAAQAGNCDTTVEFQASITWTSESSESEDSASYQVVSNPSGPTTADLDSLELISTDGLEGDNVDADVFKAVSALPLLAADAGVADALEASPAPESEAAAAGGAPTNSPGSDFWRRAGGAMMWGGLLILAAAAFAVWAFRSSRPAARAARAPREQVPNFMPPDWSNGPEGTVPVWDPAAGPSGTLSRGDTGGTRRRPQPAGGERETRSSGEPPPTGTGPNPRSPRGTEPSAESPPAGTGPNPPPPGGTEPPAGRGGDANPATPGDRPGGAAGPGQSPAEAGGNQTPPGGKPATDPDHQTRPEE